MSEQIATIVASIIAVLGVVGTAVASVLAIVISAKKNEQIERLKMVQDLEVQYDVDLRKRRIESYECLLKSMVDLAKYPEAKILSYAQIEILGFAFRDWYFTSGGLLASATTRDRYFDIQDGFKIVLLKRSNGWSPSESALEDATGLSIYLERDRHRPAPDAVMAIARSGLPDGEQVPESVSAHLRALGSALRTSMTEDVLTRSNPALRSGKVVAATLGGSRAQPVDSEARTMMSAEGRKYQDERDIWNDYNKRQEFEHELINRKTTWWSAVQTLFFAAYGVTRGSDCDGCGTLGVIVAWAGLLVAAATLTGVGAVIRSKRISWKLYRKFYRENPAYSLPHPLRGKLLQWGVETKNTYLTLVPDVLLPVIFLVAWGFVLYLR